MNPQEFAPGGREAAEPCPARERILVALRPEGRADVA